MSAFDLRPVTRAQVLPLFEAHHGYKSLGKLAVYLFAVFERERPIAAFSWQPPPPGAAKSVCPEAPSGVLALSRMVAVPKKERELRHISKPLRAQMRRAIDRGRWPVLVTYSDSSLGHTGHVYMCSGWTKTTASVARMFEDADGRRSSPYSAGKMNGRDLLYAGKSTIQRWEHWVCERGRADKWMTDHGWVRVPIQGKAWASGNQAYRWEKGPKT